MTQDGRLDLIDSTSVEQAGEQSSGQGANQEKPILRPFGMGSSTAGSEKRNRINARAVVLAGVAVATTAGIFLAVNFGGKVAPAFSWTTLTDGQKEKRELAADKNVQMASDASTVAAESTQPMQQVSLDGVEVTAWPQAKTIDEAQAQIQALKSRLEKSTAAKAEVEETLSQALSRADEADAKLKSQASKMAQAQAKVRAAAAVAVKQEEVVALSVLDITPERVLVSDRSNPNVKIAVATGAKLPGGAVFIGFDPQTRLMRTDQGEFFIR